MMTEDLSSYSMILGAKWSSVHLYLRGSWIVPDSQNDRMMMISDYHSQLNSADLSTMEDGSPFTVDSISYEVRKIEALDDGKLTRLHLAKA
jgi:hypothetical protein